MERGREVERHRENKSGECCVPTSPSVSLLGDYGGNDPVTLTPVNLKYTPCYCSLFSPFIPSLSVGSDGLNHYDSK